MTTKTREATLAELRRAVADAAARGSGHGVPSELRQQVLAFASEEKRAGRTARATASLFGLHETTLSRWSRELGRRTGALRPTSEGGFRAVRVHEERAGSLVPSALSLEEGCLRVAHPASGLVIDGLDVHGVVTLLRSLS